MMTLFRWLVIATYVLAAFVLFLIVAL